MITLDTYTTFGVGGPARVFAEVTTSMELIDAVRTADSAGEPLFVLSGGSNVLVGDSGFLGTVVHVATKGVTDDGWVAAGEVLDDFVAQSVEQGRAGLEALSGIPGLVGAAPVQNVGAYGAEIAQVVRAVRVWDRLAGEQITLSAPECGFRYRSSVFKRSLQPARPAMAGGAQATGRFVVLAVQFDLAASPLSAPIAYAELAERLGVETGARAPLAEVRSAVLEIRRSKGVVFDPADPDTHGAGSFFTNPVVGTAAAAALPPDAPRFGPPGGGVKTSAAWLIEHAGFPRGYGSGPAKLSSKHVLVLTNQGGATAADVVALAREIRAGVEARFSITLEPEPVLVGIDLG